MEVAEDPEPEPVAEAVEVVEDRAPEQDPEPVAEVAEEPEPTADDPDRPGGGLDPVARMFSDLAAGAAERAAAVPAPAPAPPVVTVPSEPADADLGSTVAALFGDPPDTAEWQRRQALDLRDVPSGEADSTPAVLGWFRRRKERSGDAVGDEDRVGGGPLGPPGGGANGR